MLCIYTYVILPRTLGGRLVLLLLSLFAFSGYHVYCRSFSNPSITKLAEHIPREENTVADALATDGACGFAQEHRNLDLLNEFPTKPSEFMMLVPFDGGARPNPCPSGCGCCVFLARAGACWETFVVDAAWTCLCKRSAYLGKQANNIAEWHGLLIGLLAVAKCRMLARE